MHMELPKNILEALRIENDFKIVSKEYFFYNNIKVVEYKSCNEDLFYFIDGKLNNVKDFPSIILSNNTRVWIKENLIHRDSDLPAISFSNGTMVWYSNGNISRKYDKPSILSYNLLCWHQKGFLNRDKNFAFISNDSSFSFCKGKKIFSLKHYLKHFFN